MLKSRLFEVSLADKQRVFIPEKTVEEFVKKGHKRVKIRANFNSNTIEFYAALIRYKSGGICIYFSKAKQKELGVFMNDYFTLQLFEDTSKYGVDMSEELEAVLMSDHEAYTIFEGLTPGRQRSIIYAISRYKSSQLRVDKALILSDNLKRGITDPRLWLKRS